MKNLLNKLEINEKDNVFTAFAKGGAKGYLKSTAVILPVLGTVALIGKCLINKEELSKIEQEIGAE